MIMLYPVFLAVHRKWPNSCYLQKLLFDTSRTNNCEGNICCLTDKLFHIHKRVAKLKKSTEKSMFNTVFYKKPQCRINQVYNQGI